MERNRQMKLHVEAHREQLETLSSQLTVWVEAQRALWEPMRRALEEQSAELARSVSAQLDAVAVSILDLATSYATEFKDKVRRTFDELSPSARKALLTLGDHGWYFDLDMPIDALWQLEGALAEGNVTEVEALLCEYFESKLDKIEASISAWFPYRSHLIEAAFSAHRRGEYALSIPLLLAQTDGICKEVTQNSLFMKRNAKPRTAEYVEQMAADVLMSAFLSPLAQTLPINESEAAKSPKSTALNRHEVLHGISLDYGTAANGLKAIALINYVACILHESAKGDA